MKVTLLKDIIGNVGNLQISSSFLGATCQTNDYDKEVEPNGHKLKVNDITLTTSADIGYCLFCTGYN